MSTDTPRMPSSYDEDISREPEAAEDPRCCELLRWNDGTRCVMPAAFHVQVGTRRYDGQDSCRRHLAATVDAMISAEDKDRPITVTRIREG